MPKNTLPTITPAAPDSAATNAVVVAKIEVDPVNPVVFVIQSRFNYRDQDNRPAYDEVLADDEGWFSERDSADIRCEQLNARNRVYYDTAVSSKAREHTLKIRDAEKKNLEAAAIRAAGMTKLDVPVPADFVPETFEKFFAQSNHTTYAAIEIRRSDYDGIARALSTDQSHNASSADTTSASVSTKA
jgi:hypothetical protein